MNRSPSRLCLSFLLAYGLVRAAVSNADFPREPGAKQYVRRAAMSQHRLNFAMSDNCSASVDVADTHCSANTSLASMCAGGTCRAAVYAAEITCNISMDAHAQRTLAGWANELRSIDNSGKCDSLQNSASLGGGMCESTYKTASAACGREGDQRRFCVAAGTDCAERVRNARAACANSSASTLDPISQQDLLQMTEQFDFCQNCEGNRTLMSELCSVRNASYGPSTYCGSSACLRSLDALNATCRHVTDLTQWFAQVGRRQNFGGCSVCAAAYFQLNMVINPAQSNQPMVFINGKNVTVSGCSDPGNWCDPDCRDMLCSVVAACTRDPGNVSIPFMSGQQISSMVRHINPPSCPCGQMKNSSSSLRAISWLLFLTIAIIKNY